MVGDDQPDAREGRSGRCKVTEMLVVPSKPGNAGGGKAPWFSINAGSSEGREIGQPINSIKCSEAAGSVTRESEVIRLLSLLRPVRQDPSARHSDAGLGPVPLQRGAPVVDRQDFVDIEAYGVERPIATANAVPKIKTNTMQ